MQTHPSSKRVKLIEKIERCVRLGASANEHESRRALDAARDLVERYEVDADELPPAVRAELLAVDVAAQLTVLHGRYTRRASDVGGARDRWHVTGRGEIPQREMIAYARGLGVTSRYLTDRERAGA